MNTVDGYAMSSWERGYGDIVFAPDLATLRRCPGSDGTVMVLADLTWLDGTPVVGLAAADPAPQLGPAGRARLDGARRHRARVHRLQDTYEEAWDSGYRDLTPANQYNVDYSILGHRRGSSRCCAASATP